jgi:2-keto-4-pentenoate hydratase/2-oxohepta-3-ene-1,7-dioic acid hydratase in catechol pathway
MTSSLVARVSWHGGVHYARPVSDTELLLLKGEPLLGLEPTADRALITAVTFLPPVVPTKILGIGANYPGEEAVASKHPSFFLMPPSALIGHGVPVVLPRFFGSVLAEGELAVVMRTRVKCVAPEDVQAQILGYTIANDLSGRDSTLEVVPAAMKKGCDGFLPLGPYMSLDPTLRDFDIGTNVDGERVQTGNTKDMIFGIAACISFISEVMTLEPYDVICMGTPPPKPKARPGSRIQITISELGTLDNTFVSQSPAMQARQGT